jgi:hypothetical protein
MVCGYGVSGLVVGGVGGGGFDGLLGIGLQLV